MHGLIDHRGHTLITLAHKDTQLVKIRRNVIKVWPLKAILSQIIFEICILFTYKILLD